MGKQLPERPAAPGAELRARSPLRFFVLVFALSTPIWLLGFAAALFHALGNLSSIGPFLDFGPGGYPYDAQRVSALLLAAAAAGVTVVWGPRTLARSSTGSR